MEQSNPPSMQPDHERRTHYHLREVFEQAYEVALPFLDPAQGWGGRPLLRHAFPALHEAFPFLTAQDLAILVPALERVFRERNAKKSS
ncbi:MAG: hypothetical protein N2Z69_00530 [Methylophilaceae bacterium]|nr:hypothetical protein [Methylophilaceae bacterium]